MDKNYRNLSSTDTCSSPIQLTSKYLMNHQFIFSLYIFLRDSNIKNMSSLFDIAQFRIEFWVNIGVKI